MIIDLQNRKIMGPRELWSSTKVKVKWAWNISYGSRRSVLLVKDGGEAKKEAKKAWAFFGKWDHKIGFVGIFSLLLNTGTFAFWSDKWSTLLKILFLSSFWKGACREGGWEEMWRCPLHWMGSGENISGMGYRILSKCPIFGQDWLNNVVARGFKNNSTRVDWRRCAKYCEKSAKK